MQPLSGRGTFALTAPSGLGALLPVGLTLGLLFSLAAGCARVNPRRDCGNGLLGPEEECDDGNREASDGCDSRCRIEPGFSCFGEPSLCQTGCGDSEVGGMEECDDGNLLPGDGCSNGCVVEPGFVCSGQPSVCESTCGDGELASTESCDDGNLVPGDGCTAACLVEEGWVCEGSPSVCEALCGNGLLDPGEECDGENLDGQSCTTVPGGFTGGDLGCSESCAFDIGGCTSPGCGNGFLDAGEQCDDGNSSPGDGCTSNCQVEQGWSCTGMPSQCVNLCGNGTLDPGEECDGALLGGMTCATVGGGYTAGSLSCDSSCQLVTLGCTTCGDGVPEVGEQCDDGNTTAGDGCDPSCQTESLPVLYYATGDPAVWASMTITYAGEPHAPDVPILAAANADQLGYAYVFTATSYHKLSLPGHQWVGSGSLASRFPDVPGSQLTSAIGISWPAEAQTGLILITVSGANAWLWSFDEDNSTGQVVARADNPQPLDWSSDPLAPSPSTTKAAFQTLGNANGWTHHDLYSLCVASQPSIPPDTDVEPYTGIITSSDQLFLYAASWCFQFYENMPLALFTPFTEPGSPTAAEVVAAFYSTEHGDRLYMIVQP